MKEKAQYTEAFRQQALEKVYLITPKPQPS